MALLLFASVRQESQTFDESAHLFAGLEYWRHADFGRNPEHPPLVKFLAAAPLLSLQLREPAESFIPFFKAKDVNSSIELLYTADADQILLRGRLVIMLFSLGLAWLVFLAGREMFGELAGLFALVMAVFEPVLLANGALVTTDVPLACLFFAAVYAFYRFAQRPSVPRAAWFALCTALALAAKHSGLLLLPTLFLLAGADLFLLHRDPETLPFAVRRRATLYAYALLGAVLAGYLGLWAIYGFRYAARPGGLQIMPNLAVYATGLGSPLQQAVVGLCARHHLLPEAYLFGWVDILRISNRPSFLFGHVYGSGQWFFLPAAFLVKSTVLLLVLLALVPFARLAGHRRELLFLALPAMFFLLAGALPRVNMGIRHLLPIYPFCIVLAGAAAAAFAERSRAARIAVAAGLLLTVLSSLHDFPDYLAYANEFAGGPSHTYRLLADSNDDWGQGLKWTKAWLDGHPSKDCWIDEEVPMVPVAYYGVRCRPLPNGFAHNVGIPSGPIPPTISGTILLTATDVSGLMWGPEELNPYALFRDRVPDARIGDAVLVYQGTFAVPLLAAESNATLASALLQEGKTPQALALAQAAAAEAPDSAEVNAALGRALLASGNTAEGQQRLATALHLAQTVHPDYQNALAQQLLHPSSHP